MRSWLLLFFLLTTYFGAAAQRVAKQEEIRKEDFFFIDGRVEKAGPLNGYVLKDIVREITDSNDTQLQKIRAFYWWEIRNIAFDCRAYHHPNNHPANASVALNKRATTSKGFAEFFKAMCDLANIRCYVVEGYFRSDPDKIGKFEDRRHYWNVVDINNTQYLIDAALGAGSTDERVREFFKKSTDAWWLANRQLFALSHFPDKKQWQLLEQPLTKAQFSKAPIANTNAFVLGMMPAAGSTGILVGREDSSIGLTYNIVRPEMVKALSLSVDDESQVPVLYDIEGHKLVATIPIKKSGEQQFSLYVNGGLVLTYKMQARPYKRPAQKLMTKK